MSKVINMEPGDKALLKTLVPIDSLSSANFQRLLKETTIEQFGAKKTLFKPGNKDGNTVYLIAGTVVMMKQDGGKMNIAAGSPLAKHPLGNFQPRRHAAVTASACKIARVGSNLLDTLMTCEQTGDETVNKAQNNNDGDDWMTKILQSEAFLQVPPGNLQAMFMAVKEREAKQGEVIVKQDEEGDCFYIIKSGTCKVIRYSKANTELTLATLKSGDTFGEEALLSGAKRNASIVMKTDGVLLTLSKKDFDELLKGPMLQWVTKQEGEALVKEGALWLDVRLESEHENNGLAGSVNVPLMMLRIKSLPLDKNKKYVIYCDTGKRSSAAAFLLKERGFDVVCLKDGLVNS